MKANEFVKAYGLDEVKYLVSLAANARVCCIDGEHIHVNDLKRLIKSHELVESYGGIDAANKTICDAFHGSNHPIPKGHEELSLAIQDVESCQ